MIKSTCTLVGYLLYDEFFCLFLDANSRYTTECTRQSMCFTCLQKYVTVHSYEVTKLAGKLHLKHYLA